MLIVVPLLVLTCLRVPPTTLQTRMKAATVLLASAAAACYRRTDMDLDKSVQYSNCRRTEIANRTVIACVNYVVCRADLSLRQHEISDRRQLLQSPAAAAVATANGAAATAASAASTASSAAGSSGSSEGTWTA